MSKPTIISYLVVFAALILAAALHMGTPFVTVLFSYFALTKLNFAKRRWLAVLLFMILMTLIFTSFVFFLRQAFVELPDIASTAIPKVVQFAERHGIDLPFTDMESLKDVAVDYVRETLGYLANFAKIATKEFLFLIVGVVIAIALFLSPSGETAKSSSHSSLYALYGTLVSGRFRGFYLSFENVMGAQLVISSINTLLTAAFVLACSLHYASVVISMTFLCGLLPIVGNIISNSVIVGVAFTGSPQLAGWALVFLVGIHKLEYFLNSKIVGSRIRQPMWLTLLGLILGERLMGIPGLILAPVVLDYIRVEGSKFPATAAIIES